jgi:hypothetical protein
MCDVAGAEGVLGLVRADDAWERSCVVDTRRCEAKDATSAYRNPTLAWAEK